jgi:hypothetical protein
MAETPSSHTQARETGSHQGPRSRSQSAIYITPTIDPTPTLAAFTEGR